MTSHVIEIPAEVLTYIVQYLKPADYGRLRRTCKSLETQLFPDFCARFFLKQQFMHTGISLRCLLAISRSRFAPCLQHVVITLHKMEYTPPDFQSEPSTSVVQMVQANAAKEHYEEYQQMRTTYADFEMLAEAFSGLENLKVVGLRCFLMYLMICPYGARTLLALPGVELPPGNGPEADRAFCGIQYAMQKSNTKATRVEAILRTNYARLSDLAFRETPMVSLGPKELLIDLQSPTAQDYFVRRRNGTLECEPWLHLKRHLHRRKSLEWLRINFDKMEHTREECSFLMWFTQPYDSHDMDNNTNLAVAGLPLQPSVIELCHLSRLDLGCCNLTTDILLGVLKKYAALETLSLRKSNLLFAHLTIPFEPEDKPNLWADALEEISSLPLRLRCLSLSRISQTWPSRHPGERGLPELLKVEIVFNSWPGTYTHTKTWRGYNTAFLCRSVMDAINLSWPPPPSESSSDHGDTQDNEEDEEDEAQDDDNEDSD